MLQKASILVLTTCFVLLVSPYAKAETMQSDMIQSAMGEPMNQPSMKTMPKTDKSTEKMREQTTGTTAKTKMRPSHMAKTKPDAMATQGTKSAYRLQPSIPSVIKEGEQSAIILHVFQANHPVDGLAPHLTFMPVLLRRKPFPYKAISDSDMKIL